MAEAGHSLLIDYKVGLDYCRIASSHHNTTFEILRYARDNGIAIDIRKDCWGRLNKSLTNEFNLLRYLRDKASETLSDYSPSNALSEFKEQVLTEPNLYNNGPKGVNFDSHHLPDMSELRNAVDSMGLKELRSYADTQLRKCPEIQSQLDLMIENKFERGGQDAWLFDAAVQDQVENGRQNDILTDAYIWARSRGNYLIVRDGGPIHSEQAKIAECMSKDQFEIVSPVDVKSVMS